VPVLGIEQVIGGCSRASRPRHHLLKKLDADPWLAEKDNWLVGMEIRSSGLYGNGRERRAQLLLDIRDANSGDIRVGPPL
jgi:hypothetical protein